MLPPGRMSRYPLMKMMVVGALALLCPGTHAFLLQQPRSVTFKKVGGTTTVKVPLYQDFAASAKDDDYSYYTDDNNDHNNQTTTTTATVSKRRPRRGPIRSARLSVSAQKQVDKQAVAQIRQAVAHQDPTLLATSSSSSSSTFSNHTTTFAGWTEQGWISSSTLRALTQWIGNETQMTRVQAMTFPLARQGWSLRVRSKTGSGKTLAFLVPLIERVLTEEGASAGSSVRLLVVAPTRELAQQIGTTAQELLAFHHPQQPQQQPKSCSSLLQVVYGGTNIVGQIRAMERNGVPSILVATPGRLVELLDRKVRGRAFQKYLQQSQLQQPQGGGGRFGSSSNNNNMMVVLDEADHVLQNFGPEMKAIFQAIPRKRQTLLFSATLVTKNMLGGKRKQGRRQQTTDTLSLETITGEPILGIQDTDCVPLSSLAIDKRSDQNVNDKAKQIVGQKANLAVNLNVQEYSLTLPSMDSYLPTLVTLLRRQVLRDDVGPPEKVVVFFPATKLVQFMALAVVATEARLEPFLQVIHSRMSQSSRQRASQSFFNSQSGVLLTSDVSARGMDYPNVTTVIQYGLPNSRELYLHRLGRTARAGHSGQGLLVSLPFERISSLRLRKQGLQPWPLKDAMYHESTSSSDIVQSAKMMASAEAAYKAFVAYYVGNRHDKRVVVDAAAEFADSVGLANLPSLPENLL
mmetsp:Transcript_5602/g.11526  ORF Transcript_5602/g.11526 Transcript_5602/m.11526 type:complete len:688 (+) Transcript_5602:131-2194(+)